VPPSWGIVGLQCGVGNGQWAWPSLTGKGGKSFILRELGEKSPKTAKKRFHDEDKKDVKNLKQRRKNVC
jgi:hypothetical protein